MRLRRILKKIDGNLKELMEDENASQVVLAYASQLPAADLKDLVEYCKTDFKICLRCSTACKVFAKVLGKASDVERLEMELHVKKIMPQVFDLREDGKELVEVFLMKADNQNLQPLLRHAQEKLDMYMKAENLEYFFAKLAELKRTDIIDSIISRVFFENRFNDREYNILTKYHQPDEPRSCKQDPTELLYAGRVPRQRETWSQTLRAQEFSRNRT